MPTASNRQLNCIFQTFALHENRVSIASRNFQTSCRFNNHFFASIAAKSIQSQSCDSHWFIRMAVLLFIYFFCLAQTIDEGTHTSTEPNASRAKRLVKTVADFSCFKFGKKSSLSQAHAQPLSTLKWQRARRMRTGPLPISSKGHY